MTTGCGSMFVVVVRNDDGSVAHLFAHLGKAGSCMKAMLQPICRQAVWCFERGVSVQDWVQAMLGTECNRPGYDGPVIVRSCVDGIAQALKRDDEIERSSSTDGTTS